MNDDTYLGTIAWDGYDSNSDGSVTIARQNMEDLIEGVIEYLDKFDGRGAYLECASIEMSMVGKNSKINSTFEVARDITETLKTIIKKRRNHGK